MTAVHHDKAAGAGRAPIDVKDPNLTRFDIVKEGLRRDDIEVMSPGSPLGRALLGKAAGDIVDYEAPGGILKVEVVAIEG